MFKLDRRIYLILFVLGFVLELAMLTFGRAWPNLYISAILWLLGGFLTVFSSIPLLVFQRELEEPLEAKVSIPAILNVLGLVVFLAVAVCIFMHPVFANNPHNPLKSDVIPTIEAMTKRLLNGEWVYGPIHYPGWTVNSSYLTMQYAPFVVAELFKFDYRWLAYLTFLVALFGWLKIAFVKESQLNEMRLKLCLIFVSMMLLVKFDLSAFAYSIELIDVAFYLFLGLSFYLKDWRMKGLALLFCLLSRYSFALWLPFYALTFYLEYGKKEAFKISGFVVSGVLLLFVIPFMSQQPTLFFDGLKGYEVGIVPQWTNVPEWYKDVGKPYTLTQGLSTSIYFYDFWTGDAVSKLSAARKLHVVLCALSVFSLLVFYWKCRNYENFNYASFLMVSLKFYFIFFYGFFYVPFSYLYLIPFLYTIALLFKVPFKSNLTFR